MPTFSVRAQFGAQVTYDSSTGNSTYLAFDGTLTQNPAMIIFDNQSTVAVTISDDGTTDGKTFAAGQALVLDMRANMSKPADDFTWPVGTQFFANSTAGTGLFIISFVYAA